MNRSEKPEFLSPDHPFIELVREVDLASVRELVTNDVNLANAFVRGDLSLTGRKWCSGKHVEVKPEDNEFVSVLHFGAFHGHAELVQLLLEFGADIEAGANTGDKENVTPIYLAAWEGNLATMRILLEARKDTSDSLELRSALHTALVHGSAEKVELLLEHGATHDIFTAAMAGNLPEVTRCINSDGSCLNKKRNGQTALEFAASRGQIETAKYLIEHGAEVPAQVAAAIGRVDEVQKHVEAEKDSIKSQYGHQPLLIWAIQGGQIEVMELLLELGADPNGGDRWGVVPLRHVSQTDGELGAAMVEMLVKNGAEIDLSSKGYTPLQAARKAQNQAVVDALLRNGATVD